MKIRELSVAYPPPAFGKSPRKIIIELTGIYVFILLYTAGILILITEKKKWRMRKNTMFFTVSRPVLITEKKEWRMRSGSDPRISSRIESKKIQLELDPPPVVIVMFNEVIIHTNFEP